MEWPSSVKGTNMCSVAFNESHSVVNNLYNWCKMNLWNPERFWNCSEQGKGCLKLRLKIWKFKSNFYDSYDCEINGRGLKKRLITCLKWNCTQCFQQLKVTYDVIQLWEHNRCPALQTFFFLISVQFFDEEIFYQVFVTWYWSLR